MELDPTNIPLYNQFGIYIGSASTTALLSTIGNRVNGSVNPSNIATGQMTGQVSYVSGFLQSSNFVTTSAGWQISADGNVEFNNGTFRGTLSAVTGSFGAVTIATNGSLSSGQTDYDTGTGFWMGNVSGTTKFSLGNSGGNKMTWNGTTLAITGSITATTGTIGGWTIGSTTLTGGGVTLDSAGIITGGTIQTASSGQRIVLNGSTNDIKVYNTSGNNVGTVYGDGSGGSDFYIRAESGNTLHLNVNNTSYVISLEVAGTAIASVNTNGLTIEGTKRFVRDSLQQPFLYFGHVNGTTLDISNTSWSVSNPSTGKYTITHNLGTTSYTCVATAIRGSGAGAYSAKIESVNSNDVKITIFDDTGTVQNSEFNFLLTKI